MNTSLNTLQQVSGDDKAGVYRFSHQNIGECGRGDSTERCGGGGEAESVLYGKVRAGAALHAGYSHRDLSDRVALNRYVQGVELPQVSRVVR